MAQELKPELLRLFREYRQSHREVFLEEIESFIGSCACTKHELGAIYRVCVRRAQHLRAPKGTKRGRPRGRRSRQETPSDGPTVSNVALYVEGGPDDLLEQDRLHHGWFRDLCMCLSDFPANRPVLLKEITLFTADADYGELATIRRAVTQSRKIGNRSKRGRPTVRHDGAIMTRAISVAWKRIVEGKTWKQVSGELRGSRSVSDEAHATPRRLLDYLAACIWHAIPPTFIREGAAGREIAPGALESKALRAYIRHRTGLPFDTHPEQCARIVSALYPRGLGADVKLFFRNLSSFKKTKAS